MDKTTLEELKKALDEERDKLVGELKAIASPDPKMAGDWDARYPQMGTVSTGSHASLDESADEVEEFEVRLESEHSLESRLLAVNNALKRMGEGTYGVCPQCKKEISQERLHANPAAEFDIQHTP